MEEKKRREEEGENGNEMKYAGPLKYVGSSL